MITILQAFPDPDALLALEPEELGEQIVLAKLKQNPDDTIHPSSVMSGFYNSGGYPHESRDAVERAILEAWSWLESENLLVLPSTSGGSNDWRQLSRRARRLDGQKKFADYRASKLLPHSMLHPAVRDRVRGAFLRGEYDTAVFHAMKEVEISVRRASGLGAKLIGVNLMRSAFHPENGPLTDFETEPAERIARMELFSGSVGSYKNPLSHRHVTLDDPLEAIEQVILASHLLRIVSSRDGKGRP